MLWYVLAGVGGLLVGYLIASYQINQKLKKAEKDAKSILEKAEKEANEIKKKAIVKVEKKFTD